MDSEPSGNKVLILSYSELHRDPRVLRQIETLRKNYQLFTAGRKPAAGYGLPFVHLKKLETFHADYPVLVRKAISLLYNWPKKIFQQRLFKQYESFYWDFPTRNILQKLLKIRPDLIIANDIDALPLAAAIKRKTRCKILFDAHEFSPRQIENDPLWLRYMAPYNTYLCRRYIPMADRCITVSEGLASEYQRLFGTFFELIKNAPSYQNLSPLPLDKGHIKLVHHGGAIPGRKLELMIEMMDHLDPRFELNLILLPTDPAYYEQLVKEIKKRRNIKLLKPVPTQDIPAFINQFDIGIFLLPPVNFNYKYALPNKFFEFIQARIATAIGPSVEMKKYVDQYGVGIVTSTFEPAEMAGRLNKLTADEIFHYKLQSHTFAKELSSETEMERFSGIVRNLLNPADNLANNPAP